MSNSISRNYKKIPMGGKLFRHEVILTTPVCENSYYKVAWQLELLKQLAETPGILRCGTGTFQNLSICYDDQRWVAELFAVELDV